MTSTHSTLSDLSDSVSRQASKLMGSTPDGSALGDSGIASRIRETVDATKDRAVHWTHTLQEGVRQDPIRSLAIAAGVGVVLGVILGRRSR